MGPILNIHGLDSSLCFRCASKYFDVIKTMDSTMMWLLHLFAIFCFQKYIELPEKLFDRPTSWLMGTASNFLTFYTRRTLCFIKFASNSITILKMALNHQIKPELVLYMTLIEIFKILVKNVNSNCLSSSNYCFLKKKKKKRGPDH